MHDLKIQTNRKNVALLFQLEESYRERGGASLCRGEPSRERERDGIGIIEERCGNRSAEVEERRRKRGGVLEETHRERRRLCHRGELWKQKRSKRGEMTKERRSPRGDPLRQTPILSSSRRNREGDPESATDSSGAEKSITRFRNWNRLISELRERDRDERDREWRVSH